MTALQGWSEAESAIGRAWSELLGFSPHPNENIFDAGADSLAVVRLAGRLTALGFPVGIGLIYRHPTIAELAAALAQVATSLETDEIGDGPTPLVPYQARFFESNPEPPPNWTTTRWFRARRPLEYERLKRALAALIDRHDALRLRLAKREGQWAQRTDSRSEPVIVSQCHRPDELAPADYLDLDIANRSMLDIERGPNIALTYVDRAGHGDDLMTIGVHHLAIDLVSWDVLIADLETAYADDGATLSVPRPTSFRRWALRLAEYGASDALHARARSWAWLPSGREEGWPRRYATEAGNGSYATGAVVRVSVPRTTTRRLLRKARSTGGMVPMLLTALHRCDRPGAEAVSVNVTHHGRLAPFEMDVSRTVGTFTSVFPIGLPRTALPAEDELEAVHRSLSEVTDGGVGFGALRYMSTDPQGPPAPREPEVGINYHGADVVRSAGRLLEPVSAPRGPGYDGRLQREHLLFVDAGVSQGALEVGWGFSPERMDRRRVEGFATTFAAVLSSL